MSKDKVQVKFSAGGSAKDTATLLLGAAAEKDLDSNVVETGSFGTFTVPQDVAKAAGLDYEKSEGVDSPEIQEIEAAEDEVAKANEPHGAPHTSADDVVSTETAPAKKAAAKSTAKKATAKKTTAKKATAKKTAAKKATAKKTAKKS